MGLLNTEVLTSLTTNDKREIFYARKRNDNNRLSHFLLSHHFVSFLTGAFGRWSATNQLLRLVTSQKDYQERDEIVVY